MNKILSIVVPSYNVEKYLPEVMPSYLGCPYIDAIEILVVNDGSSDNTAAVAEEYCKSFPDSIRLINKENGGHGSTINTGIKHAVGEYFKVIDGDDWVDTAAFTCFIEKLKGIQADLVISPFNRVNENDKSIINPVEYPEFQENRLYDLNAILDMSGKRQYAMHSLTFKTSVLKKIRPISEHCFYVDMEYDVYPLEYVKEIRFINEHVYQYRVGSQSQSMAVHNMIKNRNMHLHVIRQLEQFYDDTDNILVKKIVENQLYGLYDTQINIYCAMPMSAATRNELKNFIAGTKSRHPYFCKNMIGKKTRLLFATEGKGYALLAYLYKQTENGKNK